MEYVNGNAEIYSHQEGRIFFKETAIKYQYKIADHLGNTAVLFEDLNGDGIINTESTDPNAPPSEVLQRQFYYSFGMAMEGGWLQNTDPKQKFLYNGKELHVDLGLDWYDYGDRWYDATVGRFSSIDPLANKTFNQSPYVLAGNSPVRYVDFEGGFQIDAFFAEKYPNLTRLIYWYLPSALENDPKISKAFTEITGYGPTTIAQIFAFGTGPIVTPTRPDEYNGLTGKTGPEYGDQNRFEKDLPYNIFIDHNILENLEKSVASAIQNRDWLQAEKEMFLVSLTIMHEAAHWAVFHAKGSEESNRLEIYDQGFEFMEMAFGNRFTGTSGNTVFSERLSKSIVYKYYEDNYIGMSCKRHIWSPYNGNSFPQKVIHSIFQKQKPENNGKIDPTVSQSDRKRA